jgi:hypothetical protein
MTANDQPARSLIGSGAYWEDETSTIFSWLERIKSGRPESNRSRRDDVIIMNRLSLVLAS